MAKVFPAFLCLLILALTAIACAPAAPTATPAPTPTATPAPTATPWVTFSPRPYFSIQLPSDHWKEIFDGHKWHRWRGGGTVSTVSYQSPGYNSWAVVAVMSRFGFPRDTTVYDVSEIDFKTFLQDPRHFREVSTIEVSPGILRTHFKHRQPRDCDTVDIYGLHILTEHRSYTAQVLVCAHELDRRFDERFVERVFDGFSYE